MPFIEEISWMSKSGYSDIELLEYTDKHFDEIECKFNGEVYKEPKKRNHNFCIKCKLTLLAPGFFGWCRTGGVFSTPLHNSFLFKVRLLKFCTELLWDKMNILR